MYIQPIFNAAFLQEFKKPALARGPVGVRPPITFSPQKYRSFEQFRTAPEFREDFESCMREYGEVIDSIAQFFKKNGNNVVPNLLDTTLKSVQKSLDILKSHVLDFDKDFFSSHKPLIFGTTKEIFHEFERRLQDSKIPVQTRLNSIMKIAPQLEVCTGGMVTVLSEEMDLLKASNAGLKGAAHLVKIQMIRHLITLHVKNKHNYSPRDEVHFINAYYNHIAPEMGVARIDDLLTSIAEAEIQPLLRACRYSVLQKLKPSAVALNLGERYLDITKGSHDGNPNGSLRGQALTSAFLAIQNVKTGYLDADYGAVAENKYLIPDEGADGEIGYRFIRNTGLLGSGFMDKLRNEELVDFQDSLDLGKLPGSTASVRMLGKLFWRDNEGECDELMAADLLRLPLEQIVASMEAVGMPIHEQGKILSSCVEHVLSEWENEGIADLPDHWLAGLTEMQHDKLISSEEIVPAVLLAATYGKTAALQGMIDEKADLRGTDLDGNTALMLAARHGKLACTRVLLDACASPDTVNVEGFSAAMLAASRGHAETLELLIAHGANVNLSNSEGMSVLMFAIQNGHIDAVRLLIEAGADIHAKDAHGRSCLMLAAEGGRLQSLELLLLKGARVDDIDDLGNTAAIHAASKNRASALHMLANCGANLGIQNRFGGTGLMYAAEGGHIEAMKLLLAHDHEVDRRDRDGRCALSYAAEYGRVDAVELLIAPGATDQRLIAPNATIDLPDKDDYTPLIHAARAGMVDVARVLLANEAMVDYPDLKDATALMHAAINGHLKMAELLIENEADVLACDSRGLNAFMAAAAGGHPELFPCLLEQADDQVDLSEFIDLTTDSGMSAVSFAAQNGHTLALTKLIGLGADIHQPDELGVDALMRAAKNGHADTVDLLLARGGDVKARSLEGQSALLLAVDSNHIHTARSLIAGGADVSSVSTEGYSAMSQAASKNYGDLVKLLLQKGLNVDTQDSQGRTCASWAAQFGNLELLDILIEKGANLELAGPNGVRAPLLQAIHSRQDAAVEKLLGALSASDPLAWKKSAAGQLAYFRAEAAGNIHALKLIDKLGLPAESGEQNSAKKYEDD